MLIFIHAHRGLTFGSDTPGDRYRGLERIRSFTQQQKDAAKAYLAPLLGSRTATQLRRINVTYHGLRRHCRCPVELDTGFIAGWLEHNGPLASWVWTFKPQTDGTWKIIRYLAYTGPQ